MCSSTARVLLALGLLVGCVTPAAPSDWVFLPRPTRTDLYFDVFASSERDRFFQESRPLSWQDVFAKERLALESSGYWYDPRFLQYQLALGVALKQEDYESSNIAPVGWRSGNGWDYDFKLSLLPEHPYNLLFFSSRFEPVVKERSATEHHGMESNRGIIFRYRDKPYFFHAGYVDDVIDTGNSSSDVGKLSVDGEYFRQLKNDNELSLTGAADRSTFSGNAGLQGTLAEYHLTNLLNLRHIRLSSGLTETLSDQQAPASGRFLSDQLLWQERLNVSLPAHLSSDFSYRYHRNDSTFDEAGRRIRDFSETGQDVELHVVHRLYQSLDTTYSFLGNWRASPGGDARSQSHGLSFNYSKSIPRGTILASVGVQHEQTGNRGTGTDIVNEAHSGIAVPTETFFLGQQNVEERSIAVLLKSPLPPFETILLERDVHYTVRAVPHLNTFEIQVFSLPPQYVVPESYDFLVSYTVSGGDFTIRADSLAGNVSVELFDNLLTPYFDYFDLTSEVVSGVFPGNPLDSRGYSTGLRMHRGFLSATAEYQRLHSEVTPYASRRAEIQLVASWGPTTSVYGSAAYVSKHYLEGGSALYLGPFTESRASVAGSIQQQLFTRSLTLSLGGSYARISGLDRSVASSGTASLNWKIGKLEVEAGASAYSADSSGTASGSLNRDHAFYFVRIRRKLF